MNELSDEFGCIFQMSNNKNFIPFNLDMTDPIDYLKCGEIYWNEKFQVNCNQCNKYYSKILEFLKHILVEHLKIDDDHSLTEFLKNDNFDYTPMKTDDDVFLMDNLQENNKIFVKNVEIINNKFESNDFFKFPTSVKESFARPKRKISDDNNDRLQKKKERSSHKNQHCKTNTNRGKRLRNRSRNKLNTIKKTDNQLTKVQNKRIREKVTCEICGKIKNKHQIKIHLKSHDMSRYIYKCTECMKSFISEKSLELHQKSFHIVDGRQVNCTYEKCKRKFVSESLLKEHLKSHINPTERPFKCDLCPDKGFLYEKKLNTHIKIYHVNGKSLKCNECDRTFYLEYNLNRHKLVHKNKIKPFECDQCPSRFVSHQNLARHKKNHIEVKEYSCEICKKEFAYFQAYRAHMKYHGIICSIDPKRKKATFIESS